MVRITDLSDTKSCSHLYTDNLFSAMIAVVVVISWAIFKWFTKKLLATALRNWRPQPVAIGRKYQVICERGTMHVPIR